MRWWLSYRRGSKQEIYVPLRLETQMRRIWLLSFGRQGRLAIKGEDYAVSFGVCGEVGYDCRNGI
jgi:hypothetical protein